MLNSWYSSALKAPSEGEVEPHVTGYRGLLEAIRDDRYDWEAAERSEVHAYDSLRIREEG